MGTSKKKKKIPHDRPAVYFHTRFRGSVLYTFFPNRRSLVAYKNIQRKKKLQQQLKKKGSLYYTLLSNGRSIDDFPLSPIA